MQLNPDLAKLLEERQENRQTLTLVTGVFDLLHGEHHQFLAKAKVLADLLIVGLESDQRVTQLKGEGRPLNSAPVRQRNLMAWNLADQVFILPPAFAKPEGRESLLRKIKPDFLAVSSNSPFLDQKRQALAKINGEVVVVHQFNPRISSTKLIDDKERKQ